MDKAVANIEAQRAALAQRVDVALVSPAAKTGGGIALAQEMRAHVRAPERVGFQLVVCFVR